MTSYFEKLTSINTSSLTNLAKLQNGSTPKSQAQHDLTLALEKIEVLQCHNSQLELDLKCEHDEKVELVGIKVGLENQVLELREVNERLEFQVEQLRGEKDKIHHALAVLNENFCERGGGGIRKYATEQDLLDYRTESPSPAPSRLTPTNGLERITEEEELDSFAASTRPATSLTPHHQTPLRLFSEPSLLARVAKLEAENARLVSLMCVNCRATATTHEKLSDDEGVMMEDQATDGQTERFQPDRDDRVDEELNVILDMQRKIIGRLETELNSILLEEDHADQGGSRTAAEVCRLKAELETTMNGILERVVGEMVDADTTRGGVDERECECEGTGDERENCSS